VHFVFLSLSLVLFFRVSFSLPTSMLLLRT
jgi:hypothetical protein